MYVCRCNVFTHETPKSSRSSFKGVRAFQVELEFGNVGFFWRKKNRRTQRKTLGARTRTNNKLNPHMTPRPGIEPGPHWWEVMRRSNRNFNIPPPGKPRAFDYFLCPGVGNLTGKAFPGVGNLTLSGWGGEN